MLEHLRYEFKKFYRNRDGALFGILFPIGFALIYVFAFSNLLSDEATFDPLPVATIFENQPEQISQVLDNIGRQGEIVDDQVQALAPAKEDTADLIIYVPLNEAEADRYLEQQIFSHKLILRQDQDQIKADLEILPAANKSLSTSVLYQALESVLSIQQVIQRQIKTHLDQPLSLLEMQKNLSSGIQPQTIIQAQGNKGSSGFTLFFYACLGYICIYFMTSGSQIIINNRADRVVQAGRLEIAPLPHRLQILRSFIPVAVSSLCLTYLAYAIFVIAKIPLGPYHLEILLLLTLGVLTGLLLGMVLALILPVSPEHISAIMSVIGLILGAFAGLMAPPLTEWLQKNLSWVNMINPVALVSKGIYYLNNYPSQQQYQQNLLILAAYVIGLSLIVFLGTGGKRYETL